VPMEETLRFTLNDNPIDISPEHKDVPALFFIRDQLGLRETRYGCGSGSCGACAILVDDRAMASCDFPVSFLAGKKVETSEIFKTDGSKDVHPVLRACIQEQAGQCGYCLAGIAIRIESLRREQPPPDRERVLSELDQHLCRCGAHPRILRVVKTFFEYLDLTR
jgi:nicotinate dehydrogenase subunit A